MFFWPFLGCSHCSSTGGNSSSAYCPGHSTLPASWTQTGRSTNSLMELLRAQELAGSYGDGVALPVFLMFLGLSSISYIILGITSYITLGIIIPSLVTLRDLYTVSTGIKKKFTENLSYARHCNR